VFNAMLSNNLLGEIK